MNGNILTAVKTIQKNFSDSISRYDYKKMLICTVRNIKLFTLKKYRIWKACTKVYSIKKSSSGRSIKVFYLKQRMEYR